MGWSAISASFTTQSGSYQTLTATGINLASNASEGIISGGSNWSAINDGHAFAVVRSGSIVCVRCAKSVSTTALTYYRLYDPAGVEIPTDIRTNDSIILYERDNTVGTGTALGSISGITATTYGTTTYQLIDFNMGNNGMTISGYYQISAFGRANFGTTSPFNQIDQAAGGHLALGQYRTVNGVTVRSSRMVAHCSRNNSNQPFVRTSATSRTDWFGGTIFAATGTLSTTSGGYGIKIYGPECVFVGISSLSAIRLSSANDYIYGVTLDLAGYVPLNISAVAKGVIPKNCDQAYGLSTLSPSGFISFSGWNFTGAGNNVDISFWASKWSHCINSSLGSALTCAGNSTSAISSNRGLTKITQDVELNITNIAGTGIEARYFIRDTNNGTRLAANQIGSNPSYLDDNTYEGLTSSGVASISGVLLRVTWQNIANAAVDRYTGIGNDYRGLDNSSTDRYKIGLASYGYEPSTTIQVFKGTSAKLVPYTMLPDAGVTVSKATALTYSSSISIDVSGNITLIGDATTDQLYDYTQAWLESSGANMEAVGLGNKLVSFSGKSITVSKNLTINNGCTLSSGSKYTSVTVNGTLTINGAMAVSSYTSSLGTFVAIKVNGLVAGSTVYIYNRTDASNIFKQVVASTSYSQYVQYTSDKTIDLFVTHVSGVTANAPYDYRGTLSSNGVTFDVVQLIDPVYNIFGIDGPSISGFSADYNNLEVDLTLGTNFRIDEIYSWWCYNLTTLDGIEKFYGGITAIDEGNIQVNNSIVSIYLDNSSPNDVWAQDNRRFFRTDGARPVRNPTTGGGGIDVEWREKVLFVNDADIATIKSDVTSIKTTANAISPNTKLIPALL